MAQFSQYEMSVILVTPDIYETIRRTVQTLQRQTVKEKLELIIVGPTRKKLEIKESDMEYFAGYQVLEAGTTITSSSGRNIGIKAAKAPIVAFTEDHCLLDKEWAEALIEKHKEPWAGVGPAFYNANPGTMTSWANFVMEHGKWATPISSPPRTISGNNSSYKRKALLEYGPNLTLMLENETAMQCDMMNRGHTFCVESRAKVHHIYYSALWKTLRPRFNSGRRFAALRAEKWPSARRWFYAFASPLIPLVRFFRLLCVLFRIGEGKLFPRILPPLIILLGISGLGEMAGYAFGLGGVIQKCINNDFHREKYLIEREQKTKFLQEFLSLD